MEARALVTKLFDGKQAYKLWSDGTKTVANFYRAGPTGMTHAVWAKDEDDDETTLELMLPNAYVTAEGGLKEYVVAKAAVEEAAL